MRITLTISFFFLLNWIVAQNYYVASLRGEVYYQNKLLQKKDKVTPKGNIRFKNANSQVKLSGPGGLYTLSAYMGRTSGKEFLLTLSNELFPSIRPISTTAASETINFYPSILNEWLFNGKYYTFFDKTVLHIDPSMTANGQTIIFLHETDKGLTYRKADIRRDSMLMIRAENFNLNTGSIPFRTLILQISELAVLDTIVSHYKTIAEVIPLAVFDHSDSTDVAKSQARNQILDELGACRVINKRAFLKDMRFHIKQCKAQSQYMFLEAYGFDEYIFETYGRKIYELQQILLNEFGLPYLE